MSRYAIQLYKPPEHLGPVGRLADYPAGRNRGRSTPRGRRPRFVQLAPIDRGIGSLLAGPPSDDFNAGDRDSDERPGPIKCEAEKASGAIFADRSTAAPLIEAATDYQMAKDEPSVLGGIRAKRRRPRSRRHNL